MTFSITWNLAFEATPAAGDDASEGATRFQELKLAIRERLAIDHSLAGDANDGAHKKVTLLEQSGDPTLAANTGFFYTKDVGGVTEVFYMDSSGAVTQITSGGKLVSALPVGAIIDVAHSTVPSGFLACDGSSQLIATYPALSTAIRGIYGGADASHFYLPNLQRRVRVGAGGSGTGTLANTAGSTGGAATQISGPHTLTAAESGLPAHTHTVGDVVTGQVAGAWGPPAGGTQASRQTINTGSTGGTGASSAHTHDASNIIQPSLVVTSIIKY